MVGLLIEIEIEIKIQIDKSLINFFFGNFEYFDQIYRTEDSQNSVLNNMQLLDTMFFSRYHKNGIFFYQELGNKMCFKSQNLLFGITKKI